MADTGAPGRPTRWQKARADTKLLRWKNEAIAAAAAAPLSFGILQLVGSEDGATDELIVVGASVVAVLLLLPVAELALNWLQAPMRLLTDDVIAIRRDLSGRYSREQETAQVQAQRQELALIRQSALQASEDIRLKIEMLERCLTDIRQVAVLVTHDQMPAAHPWSMNQHSLLRYGEMLTAYRALLRFQRSYNSLLVLAKERHSQARAARMQQSLQQAVQSYDEEPLPSQLREAYTDAQAADRALRDALDALGRDGTHD